MHTKDDAQAIAKTILSQLGGSKFLAMTGAKNIFSHQEGALSFKLPSKFATDGINHVKVTLDASDTYTMTFGKIWGSKFKVVAEKSLIYHDMLQSVFTEVTGLDTSLGSMGK